MLLDAETFDLVQHIDTVLAAVAGHELEERINPELMQSVIEITTPVCRTTADVERELTAAPLVRRPRSPRRTGCASARPARTRSASSSASGSRRATATAPRRPAPVRRPARADLRHARPRRGRRAGEGDPGRQRPARPPLAAARADRELAVLARRADRARLDPADGLRRLPALGPAAALPRLRRLRRGRRPARAHRLHRRLHAHLVGHPARTRGSGRSRCASATPSRASRTRSRSPRSARRSSSSTPSASTAARRSRRTTGSSPRENKWLAARYGLEAPVMDLATGRRNRVPVAQLIRRTLRDVEPHARELGCERELEGDPRDPRPRQRRRPPAAHLQREPRHRRGRPRDRRRDRGRSATRRRV